MLDSKFEVVVRLKLHCQNEQFLPVALPEFLPEPVLQVGLPEVEQFHGEEDPLLLEHQLDILYDMDMDNILCCDNIHDRNNMGCIFYIRRSIVRIRVVYIRIWDLDLPWLGLRPMRPNQALSVIKLIFKLIFGPIEFHIYFPNLSLVPDIKC